MKVLSQCCNFVADEKSAGNMRACEPGEILDLDKDIAEQWISSGWALRCPDEPDVKPAAPVVETAAMSGAPEVAVGRRQRNR